MWNSPQGTSKDGKRYAFEDIRALTFPLDRILAGLDLAPLADVVDEPMLQRMDKTELIYAIHEVLQALTSDAPVPAGGHPGYQEAIVAELLHQTHACIVAEIELDEGGTHARQAAWSSFRQFCATLDASGNAGSATLEELGLDFREPQIVTSPRLTLQVWENILVGDGGLWDEFLWDDDWRIEILLDVPRAASEPVTDQAGINLELVHRLPPTPTAAEAKMAEAFIRQVIFRDESPEPRGNTSDGFTD